MKGVQAAVLGGSALVLLILALRLTLKNHLPRRLLPALWCVAALRLLLPVEIPTRLSVWNLLRGTAEAQTAPIAASLLPFPQLSASQTAPAAAAAQPARPGQDVPDATPAAGTPRARAEQFLRDIFRCMGLTVAMSARETDEGYVYDLSGESLGILIGKHGQTLDALQYLTNLAANRGVSGERLHVLLDIEGYRARREETLTRLAGHLAEKACRIGQEIHLEPMNRHERKIIHMALQDSRKVSTYSAGDEPRRYVVIVPRRRRRAESSQRGRENE